MRRAAAALALACLPAACPAGGLAEGAAPAAAAMPAGPSALQDFLREADAMLLAGEALPVDLMLRLAPLAPADRLLAVAHLRRSGLLQGRALPLDRLLDEDATEGGTP